MIIYITNYVSKALHVVAVLFLKQHYFFDCLNYQDQRQEELFSSINNFLSPDYPLSFEILLRGNTDLTVNNNVFLTTEVLKFIHNSARFM